MSEIGEGTDCRTECKSHRAAVAYTQAISFLLPPAGVLAVAVIFILPKLKQMCADVGYDPGSVFAPMDTLVENWWLMAGAALVLVVLAENLLPFWRRHRRFFLASIVFIFNSAVLVGLTMSLVVASIVGPAMRRL